MFAASPLMLLLIVWAVVTLVFVGLMIYRSVIGMEEEGQLFLDPVEGKMEQEHRAAIARVERVTTYAKAFGYTSVALLLVLAGLWVYRGFTTFTSPPMP